MENIQIIQNTRFVTSSQPSVFVQNSRGPWPPERRDREEREGKTTEQKREMMKHWNTAVHSIRLMTHMYLRHAFVHLACGNAECKWGCREWRGAGWGQQYIPEYITRCSRSDRSQPWLMKPKHFHRCFYTLGSTSSAWPSSTHPQLISLSNRPL